MKTSSILEAGYMHASLSHIALNEALANRMGPYMLPGRFPPARREIFNKFSALEPVQPGYFVQVPFL